jgi:hypothetical protein
MTVKARVRPGRCAARVSIAAILLLALAVVAPACHRDIHLLPPAGQEGAAGAGIGGAAGSGGVSGSGVDGAAAGGAGGGVVCSGDPIMLPTMTGSLCAGTLEARGHQFALCTCDTLNLNFKLQTDAFDSTNSGVHDETSAAVGVDGALQTNKGAELQAGGAIYVAGSAGVNASEHLQAGASFRSNGPLAMLSSSADLLSDAYIGAAITGQVQVRGTLHVPSSADVGPDVQADPVVTEAVSVAAPCDCRDSFVDLATAMNNASAVNNDAVAGLDADVLSNVTVSQRLDLACGTYYLSSIQASAPITLAVHGRVLLAVEKDVALKGGGLTVNLDRSAELDLLIGGWLTASGGGTIGVPTAPARFRIWTAGTDPLVFADQPTVAAVIHAPYAAVTATNGLAVYGSLLVKSLTIGDDSLLHYDRAILQAGVPCGEPAAAVVP